MSEISEFDAFYGRTRRRVLLQCLVLTATVPEATAVTIGAYEQAWRRWRKLGRDGADGRDGAPERWVRSQVYAAPRRTGGTTVPPTSADSPSSPTPDHEQAALLATLATLSVDQRAVWALVEVAGLGPDEAAAELDLPSATVRRELAAARSTLADPLGSATGDSSATSAPAHQPWTSQDVVVVLEDLAHVVSLPTPPRLRASGPDPARRRRRALLPVAAAAGAVAVAATGWAVVSATDAEGPATPDGPAAAEDTVTPRVLLGPSALEDLGPGGWVESATTSAPVDAGPGSLCQLAASADPASLGVQSRRFTSGSAAAEETVVVSRSVELAASTYERAVGWWTGCTNVTALLQGAYAVPELGEEAIVLTLRDWADPTASYVVGLARAGAATVSLVSLDPVASAVEAVAVDEQQPGTPQEAASVLADAVATACAAEAADCETTDAPTSVSVERISPPDPPGSRGLLATVDLPPAGDLAEPWSTSPPVSADGELRPSDDTDATTPCDTADLATAGAGDIYSRTFTVPGDPDLPSYFGLAETVATFATPDLADQYVADTVEGFGTCSQRVGSAVVANLGEDLTTGPAGRAPGVMESAVYALAYDNEQDERIFLRTAVVRNDTGVARVTLVPGPDNDMTREQFDIVVVRAQARLAAAGDQPSS
ncbi:hypothetical protein KLP28_04695 [Nocardioidaceae bacterium]|nr:hypothetical protein KLP28_04695 [Nocardioidaceae bacterium]